MNNPVHFSFRLYIAGDSPNSTQARANLEHYCRQHLANRYDIELVDVQREPGRALADNILLTPTLVKLAPAPVRKIFGNLSQLDALTQLLEASDTSA